MTLSQALTITRQQQGTSRQRKLFLVCGFEPLHLNTFLRGHLTQRFPDEEAILSAGVYGDLEGTLSAAADSDAEAAGVVIEWADIDSRLGLRSAGGWALSKQSDILAESRQRFARLLDGIESLARKMPVALAGPTLPIALMGHTAGWNAAENELLLESALSHFLAEASKIQRVSILSRARLDLLSPPTSRQDPLIELKAGFPYTTSHASILAELIVQTLFPPAPMKGLITDLDHTFWAGIVGEDGASGVSWSLADHTQIHGLYQQLLQHFSEMGVLLAIASKNEQLVVDEALRREDLRIPRTAFFPVLANWGPKSASIGEILRTWNIDAGSVVFVDDTPMELEEARTAFPGLTTLQFSKQPAKAVALFAELRDLFGKPRVGHEDTLRQASIQAAQVFGVEVARQEGDQFVRGLKGRIDFDLQKNAANLRPLELINKTNQFNLNGHRLSEGEWLRHLEDAGSFVIGVTYEDKFGPLGTISVVAGRRDGSCLDVTNWVLSCRAFSRRIEHHTLDFIFRHFGVDSVQLAYHPTDRNQPLGQFLRSVAVEADGPTRLGREQFYTRLEELPHEVRIQ